MVKLSSQTLEGNDRYEGFGIDLIKELSEMSGFNYTFKIQEDLSSGYLNPKTKKWTGMIGEVINGVSDTIKKNNVYFKITTNRNTRILCVSLTGQHGEDFFNLISEIYLIYLIYIF